MMKTKKDKFLLEYMELCRKYKMVIHGTGSGSSPFIWKFKTWIETQDYLEQLQEEITGKKVGD